MRAARRVIVLAGVLVMAVLAPLGWNQAGAQTEENSTFTFVKVLCADFGAIPGNHFEPDGLSARPQGTTLGEPIGSQEVSADEPTPDGCVRAEGWQFLIGGESDMVENPPGRQVSPTPPAGSATWSATAPTGADGRVTVVLNGNQQALLAQGGLRLSELQQDGFAFGTLRCGLDNRNGDNAEHMGAGPTTCVAYNVGAPVTVTKVVEGTIPQGPFELTISCGNNTTSFTLDDGGTTTLWMPYDTDCSLVETNDGGADRVSFAVNGEDATSGGEGEGEESDSVLEFTTPDLDLELNRVADTNIEVTNTGTSADVSVTKAGSPATVAQGAPVSFTITVTNGSGGDAAEGVVLTDDLPAGLTWSLPEPVVDEPEGETPEGEASAEEAAEGEVVEEEVDAVVEAPACAIDANSLRCDIGTLEPGGSFAVTVTSDATARCGVVTNENATVTSDTPDPNEDNNAAAASVGVTCPPAPAPQNVGTRPVDETTTTTTSTTTTTISRVIEEIPPPPQPVELPPPPPEVLATTVVRAFVPPPDLPPPPPELPPPPPPQRTRSAPVPEAPAVVVLRTVNPSATPGGVLGVTGEGCDPNADIEFTIDGEVVGTATANADGTFQSDLKLPVLDIGRSVLHAECGGATDTNFDVVLTTSSVPAGSLGIGIMFLSILAVIAFAHPLAAAKKG